MASQAVTPEKIAPLDQRPSPKFSHSSSRDLPRHSDDGRGYAILASGPVFRFCPAAGRFYVILAAIVIAYLIIVEVAKNGFYRWIGGNRGAKTRRVGPTLTLASSVVARKPTRDELD
jgi:hypothetical protein